MACADGRWAPLPLWSRCTPTTSALAPPRRAAACCHATSRNRPAHPFPAPRLTRIPRTPFRPQVAGCTLLAIGYSLAAAFVVVAVANTASHGLVQNGRLGQNGRVGQNGHLGQNGQLGQNSHQGQNGNLCYGVPVCIPVPEMVPPAALPATLAPSTPATPLSFRHALAHDLAGAVAVGQPTTAALGSHYQLTHHQPWTTPHAAGGWLKGSAAAVLRLLGGRVPAGQPGDPPRKQNAPARAPSPLNSPPRASPLEAAADGHGDVRSFLGRVWCASDSKPGLDAMCGLLNVC